MRPVVSAVKQSSLTHWLSSAVLAIALPGLAAAQSAAPTEPKPMPDMSMPDKSQSRRDGLTIAAINPVDGKQCSVLMLHSRLQLVAKLGMGHVKEAGYIVPTILQSPAAVFEGLRREEDDDKWGEGWRCYCGIPKCAYREDGSERTPYPGQVFLVFVTSGGEVYNWRWERGDQVDARLPEKHDERFTRRLI